MRGPLLLVVLMTSSCGCFFVRPAWCQDFDDSVVDVDKPDVNDPDDVGRFLFASLLTERARLKSGRCLIKEFSGPVDGPYSQTGMMDVLFDSSQQSYRFEYINDEEPYLSCRYVETPKGRSLFSGDGNILRTWPSQQVTWKMRPQRFLDPRNLGLVTLQELDRKSLQEVRDGLGKDRTYRGALPARNDAGCLLTCDYRIGKVEMRRHYELDPNKAYAATHMEVRWPDQETGEWPADPMHSVDTTWEHKSELWVPLQVTMTKHWGKTRVRTLKLQWLMVNSEIPAEWFDQADLSSPR